MTRKRLTPNLFGIPFGLCGLAGVWHIAGSLGLASAWVPEHPAGHVALIYLTAAAISAGILLIAIRTLVALTHGSFLPPAPAGPHPAAEQVAARLGA